MAERRREEVVSAARELLEEGGPQALTMRAIGERVGMRGPSLYKHFADKEAIETALVADGMRDLGDGFASATEHSDESIAALARAYRAWALAHPHLYRLMKDRPLRRDLLPDGLEARVAEPLVEASNGDVPLARATWGLAHGLVSLELAGRFPPDADIDAAWDAGISALTGHRVG